VNGVTDNNRRKYERFETDLPVGVEIHQWKGEGAFQGQNILDGHLYDVSEGGLKIRTSVPLALDMFLKIHLPQDAGIPTLIGRIIRCEVLEQDYQYGCLVTGMSLIDQRHLETYMDNRKKKEQ